MNPLDLLTIGAKIIDKIIPDPAQKAQAQLDLLKLQQSGELAQLTADTQLAQGQIDVDKVEAASPSLFVSGWRPFVGWICGIGLGVQFIVSPLVTFAFDLMGRHAVVPTLDLGTLMTLLVGLLGLGTMRSVDKFNGVASK